MNICLLGFTDKRPIVYSLAKVLGQVGRTVFITPNMQYTQLSDEYEQDFEVMGLRIICEPVSFGEILSETDTQEYNYIIFDCLVELPERPDIVLIQDNLDYYREMLEVAGYDMYQLFINKELTAEKENTYFMAPLAQLDKTCRQIEKNRLPYPFTSPVHNKLMAALLEYILQMPAQSIMNYLKRGVK